MGTGWYFCTILRSLKDDWLYAFVPWKNLAIRFDLDINAFDLASALTWIRPGLGDIMTKVRRINADDAASGVDVLATSLDVTQLAVASLARRLIDLSWKAPSIKPLLWMPQRRKEISPKGEKNK